VRGLFGGTVSCYDEGVEGGLGILLVCVCASEGTKGFAMITGSRNLLQASIDERAEVIARLIQSVPELIHAQFTEYEEYARTVARDSSDGDEDVFQTIYSNEYNGFRPDDEEWMIVELYRSMVLLICSFAEGTIKDILPEPKPNFSSNFLCCAYNYLNDSFSLGLKTIGKYWKGHQDFTQKRNDIAHNRRDVEVTKEDLLDAIKGSHDLLRAIADAIDKKEREQRMNCQVDKV